MGVIFAIMMSASMVRDMSGHARQAPAGPNRGAPVDGTSTYLVSTCRLWRVPVNLLTVFFILYAFTYEYSTHMYFPYILSYLFLIFISPVTSEGLSGGCLGYLRARCA